MRTVNLWEATRSLLVSSLLLAATSLFGGRRFLFIGFLLVLHLLGTAARLLGSRLGLFFVFRSIFLLRLLYGTTALLGCCLGLFLVILFLLLCWTATLLLGHGFGVGFSVISCLLGFDLGFGSSLLLGLLFLLCLCLGFFVSVRGRSSLLGFGRALLLRLFFLLFLAGALVLQPASPCPPLPSLALSSGPKRATSTAPHTTKQLLDASKDKLHASDPIDFVATYLSGCQQLKWVSIASVSFTLS